MESKAEVDVSKMPTLSDMLRKAREFYQLGWRWEACTGFAANYYGLLSDERTQEERQQLSVLSHDALSALSDQLNPIDAFDRALTKAVSCE